MRRLSRTRRHRGAVLVEYALLLMFFAVPVCAGITAASLQMLAGYRATRSDLLRPLP
jgi:Flp pilus assembly pilin Flp